MSPESQSGPCFCPAHSTRKPTVSGSMSPIPGGPCRAGVAVTRPFLDLTDELVYTCNRWDPLTARELKKLAKRRSPLLKIFGQ